VTRSAAARLFIERARAADTGFTFDPSDAPALARLCRALDGLPLALELAATRVRTLGLKELAERLGDRFSLLSGGGRTVARHATLRAAIEWSYVPLDDESRRLLRNISVFRGSFTLADVQALAGEPALEQLITLVDRCLVQREAGTSPARFRLLESIRAFAASELRSAGEEQAARDRHLGWCRDVARAGAIPAPYVGDVDASLAWAARDPSRVPTACELAEQIVPRPGAVPLDLVAARLGGILGCETDAASRIRVLRIAAEVALRVGSPEREPLARELVEASRRAGAGLAKGLLLAGSAAASHGRFEEALTTLDEAAAYAEKEEDDATLLQIRLRNASVRLELGRHDVIEPLSSVVSEMRARGDPSLAIALNNLAIAYEREGSMNQAMGAHAEALDLRRGAGDTMGEVTTLVNLAAVLVRGGRFAEARARLSEAIHHPAALHNMLRLASICGTAGELLAAEGRMPLEAARLLGAHQRIREDYGRRHDEEDDAQYRPFVSALIAAVGDRAYERAFREGHALDSGSALDMVAEVLTWG
jgi:predicted ATPase